jgi:hypothetical protein
MPPQAIETNAVMAMLLLRVRVRLILLSSFATASDYAIIAPLTNVMIMI